MNPALLATVDHTLVVNLLSVPEEDILEILSLEVKVYEVFSQVRAEEVVAY